MTAHDQLELLPSRPLQKPSAPVDKNYLHSLPNLRRVIRYSVSLRDLEPKQVYEPLGKDQAVWSRIESGNAYFPADQLLDLARICDNHAPLMWLAHRAGYELVPLRSELEEQLEAERAKSAALEQRLEVITNFVRSTR